MIERPMDLPADAVWSEPDMHWLRELRIRHTRVPESTIKRLGEALPECTIY